MPEPTKRYYRRRRVEAEEVTYVGADGTIIGTTIKDIRRVPGDTPDYWWYDADTNKIVFDAALIEQLDKAAS